MLTRLLAAVLLLSPALPLAAQDVPTPRQAFGFEIGTDRKLANWDQLSAYYEKVAEASPRVKLDTLGRTTRGHPFIMLTITSAQNQSRLDRLHSVQMQLADPRRIAAPQQLQRLLDEGRTVVLMTHSIHSTEVGGAQMAARLVYDLATSDDPRIRQILDNVILLDIPSLNPDGTQWVVDWYNQYLGTPYEGTAPPWLYQFYVGHDNNRDWYAFTQKETQLTVQKAHNVWHPEIVHDIHQMGSSGARIFFPPYIDPVEPNVDPGLVAGVNQLGTWMQAALTAQGKAGSVIDAIYDAWTPARAYQHYHGGVRILSETASARIATPIDVPWERIAPGREYDPRERSWKFPMVWTGGRWGLPQIVDYMQAGAMALLTNAAVNRHYWLENFYEINKRAVERWPSWPAAWVIPADQPNATGLSYVLRILTMGDVEVHRASVPFTADGLQFAAGTYVIPMNQPYASFAETLLEVQHYPDLREYPGGPPKRPYDVTAHTLPLLMNVQAVPVREWSGAPPTLGEPVGVPDLHLRLPPALTDRRVPRIALYKSWQEPMEAGWTRWVFDQYGLRYDTLKDARIRMGNLRKDYDVILLQSQSPRSIRSGNPANTLPPQYTGGMSDVGVQAIKEFVENGGRLVAIEDATDFAIDLFGLNVKNAVAGLGSQDFYVPGSILQVDLATGDPLTTGYGSTTPVWFSSSSRAFDVDDARIRVIARYAAGNPLLSGWILGPAKLAGKPALLQAAVGKGTVVLFGFQPNYRAQSVATWPLLFNALTPGRR